MKYKCPMCNSACRPVQYTTGDWWIRHGADSFRIGARSDTFTRCPLDYIMPKMNEETEYSYLFVDLHAKQLRSEVDVWNEFMSIYDTKLIERIALDAF